jgi:hypothetical protein
VNPATVQYRNRDREVYVCMCDVCVWWRGGGGAHTHLLALHL